MSILMDDKLCFHRIPHKNIFIISHFITYLYDFYNYMAYLCTKIIYLLTQKNHVMTSNSQFNPNSINEVHDTKHHGEFIKSYLESNKISIIEFQEKCQKSHAWVYGLFNTKKFTFSQTGIVCLSLGIEPTKLGFNTNFSYSAESLNLEMTDKLKIAELEAKNVVLEKTIKSLENIIEFTNKMINTLGLVIEEKNKMEERLKFEQKTQHLVQQ